MLVASAFLLALAPDPEPELELRWSAPQRCPDDAAVQTRIRQMLRRPLGDATELGTLKVSATVEGTGSQWAVILEVVTDSGEDTRTLRAASCETLAETVALVVAMTLDPEVDPSLETATEPEPPAEPQPSATAATPTPSPAPDPKPVPDGSPAPAPPKLRVGVLVATSIGLGITPRFAGGVTTAASLMWQRARAQIRVDHFFPRTVAAGAGVDAAGTVALTSFGLRGCGTPSVDIVDFPVCGGFQGGIMRGEGVGVAASTVARLPLVAFDFGIGVGVAPRGLRGILAFVLSLDIVVPLTRPGFVIDDIGLVNRVFPALARVTAGVEVRLPGLPKRGGSR